MENKNIQDVEKRLLKLTQFWYDYVGCDHHKDRDCHFYIKKVWSYGKQPVYCIEHYGYMTELENNELYETYEEALKALVDWLEDKIKEVYASTPQDWEDEKKWYYNWKGFMQVLKKHNLYPITFKN